MKTLSKLKTRCKIILAAVLTTAVVVVLLPILLYTTPSLPPGTHIITSPTGIAAESIQLLIDDTAWDPETNRRVIDQEIFDEILAMIHRADQFIYVDLFLWNPWQGSIPEEHRQLSRELAEALIARKKDQRGLDVIVLSDPINRIYGGHEPEFFKDMAKVGIPVVFTDLSELPDSNTIYSPYWALTEKFLNATFFSKWAHERHFSNPFERDGDKISALQFGRMLMFKANHRKVVITGSTEHGLEMAVGSLNTADGSSAHSNLALAVKGKPVLEALQTELAALRWSIKRKQNVIVGATGMAAFKADSIENKAEMISSISDIRPDGPEIQWLTEGTIAKAIINLLGEAGPEDKVRIAIFYLSERGVIEALKGAITRGASVRVVLDANRDAFGMKKIGVPNRPVAAELMKLSTDHDVDIRWADTHGEQFHTKAMSITFKESGEPAFITGSANWTRRNIGDFNMEANLLIKNAGEVTQEFNIYFDRIWSNSDGLTHTLPYEAWEEKGFKGFIKTGVYRFQERFGLGTF
ncbi:phospholipase D-like domain-containing protein [bacterium]|nr:phospholipase D-like domain-containing protein [bacterium]